VFAGTKVADRSVTTVFKSVGIWLSTTPRIVPEWATSPSSPG
jgi:hypothetical protein